MPRKGRNPKRGGGGSRPPNAPSSGDNTRSNFIPAVPSSTTSSVLLPLISSFDSTKMQKKIWKTDIEGLKSEEAVPMYGGSLNREEFLYFLHAFQDFASSFDLTTGKQLFGAFRSLLYGPAKERWDTLTDGNAKTSLDDFKRFRLAWLSELFDVTDYDSQLHYLQEVKKPRDMSVEKFVARIQTIALLMKHMPRDPGHDGVVLTEYALKRIVYFACPIGWRQKFEDLDKNVTAPLATILRHMKRQEAINPSFNSNTNSNRTGRPNNGGSNNGGGNNSGGNNNGGGSTTSQAGNGNKPRGNKLGHDAPCPIHPGGKHTWGKCFDNKNRVTDNAQDGASNNNNRNRSNQQCSSHMAQTTPPSTVSTAPTIPATNRGDQYTFAEQYCVQVTTPPVESTVDLPLDSPFTLTATSILELDDGENELPPVSFASTENYNADVMPVTPVLLRTAGTKSTAHLHFVSLLDSGGSHTMVNSRALPKLGMISTVESNMAFSTIAGAVQAGESVLLEGLIFPEINRRVFYNVKAFVFHDDTSPFDIIAGRDLLRMAHIKMDFQDDLFSVDDRTFPFRNPTYWSECDYGRLRAYLRIDPPTVETWLARPNDNHVRSSYAASIKDADYHRTSIDDVLLTHLSSPQQLQVRSLLYQHEVLFSGILRAYPKRKAHLDLKPDAIPFHGRAYAVPQVHRETFRKELHRLVDIGVLGPAYESEWAAPTFIIPKKDGTVRVVTDFRKLNHWIARKQFPLPKINDIIRRRASYVFLTLLDVSMQYYTFVLDESSADLCTIVTPFGKFKYLRLPMGVNQSPDFSQAVMTELFETLPYVEAYLDDIGLFHVSEVLRRLSDAGFTMKPDKCKWFVREADFLGFRLTPSGFKPMANKVQGILDCAPPHEHDRMSRFRRLGNVLPQHVSASLAHSRPAHPP
jgi:hypothetical protein